MTRAEDGRVGVIIRLKHGYIYNRPPAHEQSHREQCQEALAFLLRSGYYVSYYNREIQDSNLEPLKATKANLDAFKETEMYNDLQAIIQHITYVCSNVAFSEEEYYLIIANNQHTIEQLDKAVHHFSLTLQGSLYLECKQLDNEELMKFPMMLFGLQFINNDQLLQDKYSDLKVNCVVIEHITYDTEQTNLNDDDLI